MRGLIVQTLRARGRTLRLGLNQLRVFFRVVHAQTVPLCRALLRLRLLCIRLQGGRRFSGCAGSWIAG